MEKLKKENEILDIFCQLASIPSPSLKEEKVVEWIKTFAEINKLKFRTDDFGNVIVKVDATDNTKKTVAVSAHMDVVGDDSPIIPSLDGNFIHATNRTLGADDKVGVACALKLAKDIVNSDIKHGGLEVVLTKDEESSMSGIKNFDFADLSAQYVLVCDADKLGELQVSGASYVNVNLKIKAFFGGHSGIDIADKNRPNAAKILAEICNEIPQGVYYADETGVITSINLGGISSGDVKVTNVINTDGEASYSIRSASLEKENELIAKIKDIVSNFNDKYKNIAVASLDIYKKLSAFEKSDDTLIPDVFAKAAQKLNLNYSVSSFHAAAETHIYCLNKNAKDETFIPFLLGLADIYNMHSSDEKVDYTSIIKGSNLLLEVFLELNK